MAAFNLAKVTLIYGFIPFSGGWAEGDDVIQAEPIDPSITHIQGASGDVQFNVTGKRLVRVKLKFLSTSLNNALMTGIHVAQVDGGLGGGPLAIKDGANFIISPEAMIEAPPAYAVGAQAGPREWSILAADCRMLLGGNP